MQVCVPLNIDLRISRDKVGYSPKRDVRFILLN